MDTNISVRAAVRSQVTALTSCFSLLGVLLQIFTDKNSEVRFSKYCRRARRLLRRQEQKYRLTFPLHYLIKNALERAVSTPHLVTHQVTSQKGSESPAREQICSRTIQLWWSKNHFLSLWWLHQISSLGDNLIKWSAWSEVSMKVLCAPVWQE